MGHHDHDHDHHHHHGSDHHHDHDHDHHHEHSAGEAPSTPSEKDKLVKMVEHWIHHNEEHVRSYRDWAQRALVLGQEEVRSVLEQIANDTQLQTQSFEKIRSILKNES